MNYKDYINQEIVNKNNEIGIVVDFTETCITVQYPNGKKSYNPDIAFRNGFLSFSDNKIQALVNEGTSIKESIEKAKEQEIEDNRRQYLARRAKVNETFQRLNKKYMVLVSLFGDDFYYPPYAEFIKKYEKLIDDRDWIDRLFSNEFLHDTHYREKYCTKNGTLLL